MRRYPFLALIPVVFVLDRITKSLVVKHLTQSEAIDITPFFSLVHARNFGGVFSLLHDSAYAKYIFTILPVGIAAVLVYVLLKYSFEWMKVLALSLILAGALGNIYDRFVYGSVVDFLDFYCGSHHWPAFNVADISVSVGIGIWVLAEFRAGRKQGMTRGKTSV